MRTKYLHLIWLLVLGGFNSKALAVENTLQSNINAGVSVLNVGPVIPTGVLRIVAYVNFKDLPSRRIIGTTTHPWWKNLRIVFQQVEPITLKRGGFQELRSAEKLWRIEPALDDPLEPCPVTGLEQDALSKNFIVELHPAIFHPGSFYMISVVLDTRTLAEQNKQVVALFVPQVGAQLFQVQPPDTLVDKQAQLDFLSDKYYGELLTGKFEEALATRRQAVGYGLTPVEVEFSVVETLVYQGKYQEAVAQYEKVLRLDEEAIRQIPRLEPLVLPSTLAAFKAKVQKKMAEQKN